MSREEVYGCMLSMSHYEVCMLDIDNQDTEYWDMIEGIAKELGKWQ